MATQAMTSREWELESDARRLLEFAAPRICHRHLCLVQIELAERAWRTGRSQGALLGGAAPDPERLVTLVRRWCFFRVSSEQLREATLALDATRPVVAEATPRTGTPNAMGMLAIVRAAAFAAGVHLRDRGDRLPQGTPLFGPVLAAMRACSSADEGARAVAGLAKLVRERIPYPETTNREWVAYPGIVFSGEFVLLIERDRIGDAVRRRDFTQLSGSRAVAFDVAQQNAPAESPVQALDRDTAAPRLEARIKEIEEEAARLREAAEARRKKNEEEAARLRELEAEAERSARLAEEAARAQHRAAAAERKEREQRALGRWSLPPHELAHRPAASGTRETGLGAGPFVMIALLLSITMLGAICDRRGPREEPARAPARDPAPDHPWSWFTRPRPSDGLLEPRREARVEPKPKPKPKLARGRARVLRELDDEEEDEAAEEGARLLRELLREEEEREEAERLAEEERLRDEERRREDEEREEEERRWAERLREDERRQEETRRQEREAEAEAEAAREREAEAAREREASRRREQARSLENDRLWGHSEDTLRDRYGSLIDEAPDDP